MLHFVPPKVISPPGSTSSGPNRASTPDLSQLEGPSSSLCWGEPNTQTEVSRWDLVSAEQRGIVPPLHVLTISLSIPLSMLLAISPDRAHWWLMLSWCLPRLPGPFH